MPFFKDLAERIGDYTLTLTIQRDKGQLVVMLVPKLEAKKDDALKEIIPLTVKGTPDQLDAGFILAISSGIQMTTGLQTNIKEFEASLKKAEKKVKGKEEKDQKSSDAKDDKVTDMKIGEDHDADDNGENEDDLPFGDDKNIDTETGEIKESAPKKEPEHKSKTSEPKAKEPKPKEEKKESVAPSKLTGDIVITTDDEWD